MVIDFKAKVVPALVSVFIPTKDRLDLLKVGLHSVLTQSYPFVEIIVVNDGSADGTRDYLDNLVLHTKNIRVIHHDRPVGAPRSRNEAIDLADGEWITGLDDDDLFHAQRIEFLLAYALMLESYGMRFSGVFSQSTKVHSGEHTITVKRGCIGLDDLFRENYIGNQLFARKSVYQTAGLFDEALPAWQDLDMYMRMCALHGPARLLDCPLYYFSDDDRPDRISRKSKAKIVEAYRLVVAKWPDRSAKNRQQLYMQIFSRHYGFSLSLRDLMSYFAQGFSWSALLGLCRTIYHL